MKKQYIVRKNQDFSKIMRNGKKYQSENFSIYILNNDLNYNRYGISISKKLGNAVERNKFKRQIRDIIDNYNIKFNGFDIILIGRLRLKDRKYIEIKEDIAKIFDLIGEKNEKKQF